MEELIYLIGEAIIMEIEDVENLSYPQGDNCEFFKIVMKNGKCYELHLKAL